LLDSAVMPGGREHGPMVGTDELERLCDVHGRRLANGGFSLRATGAPGVAGRS
jgi:hypothetical protein